MKRAADLEHQLSEKQKKLSSVKYQLKEKTARLSDLENPRKNKNAHIVSEIANMDIEHLQLLC